MSYLRAGIVDTQAVFDLVGRGQVNASVKVFDDAGLTTPSTLYATNSLTGSTVGNPFTTNSVAMYPVVYATVGDHWVQATIDGVLQSAFKIHVRPDASDYTADDPAVWIDLRARGASTSVSNNSSIIQQATADVIAAGGGTVLFSDSYPIQTMLTIGTSSTAGRGVIWKDSRGTSANHPATLVWTGATGGGATMTQIRNSFGGELINIGFDSNNKADYGLQLTHTSGDPDTVEAWTIRKPLFVGARKYNLLIGQPNGVTSSDDVSDIGFYNPTFLFRAGVATVAHVRCNADNAFAIDFFSPVFFGAASGTANPTYHVSASAGTLNFYGVVSNGTGSALHYDAKTGLVPATINVFSWESQDDAWCRCDTTGSAAPVHGHVWSGVTQTITSGDPAVDSVQWNHSDHGVAGLTVVGSVFENNFNIQSADARVASLGTRFYPGAGFSGHTECVEFAGSPVYGTASGQYVGPGVTIGQTVTVDQQLYYVPFVIHRSTLFDRIAVEVTVDGGAGSVIRMGIYADNGSAQPGALIVDAGAAVSTGIADAVITRTISQTLGPGLYWLAACSQGAPTPNPTVRYVAAQLPEMPTYPLNFAVGINCWTQGSVAGALPATASGLSLSGAAPVIRLRAA